MGRNRTGSKYKIGKRLGSLYPLYVLKQRKKSKRQVYVCVGFVTGKENAYHLRIDLNIIE